MNALSNKSNPCTCLTKLLYSHSIYWIVLVNNGWFKSYGLAKNRILRIIYLNLKIKMILTIGQADGFVTYCARGP